MLPYKSTGFTSSYRRPHDPDAKQQYFLAALYSDKRREKPAASMEAIAAVIGKLHNAGVYNKSDGDLVRHLELNADLTVHIRHHNRVDCEIYNTWCRQHR